MTPGEILTCVDNSILDKCLTLQRQYMALDVQNARAINWAEPSVLIRSDEGQEIWFLQRRFQPEAR